MKNRSKAGCLKLPGDRQKLRLDVDSNLSGPSLIESCLKIFERARYDVPAYGSDVQHVNLQRLQIGHGRSDPILNLECNDVEQMQREKELGKPFTPRFRRERLRRVLAAGSNAYCVPAKYR